MQPSSSQRINISFRRQEFWGWLIVAILCLLPVVLWHADHDFDVSFNTPENALLSLGRLTGLVGLAMYSINLILSARLRIVEDWFGGLNRAYVAHHLIGGVALILLAFHPVLLAGQQAFVSMRDAALLLFPHGLLPLSAVFYSSADLHAQVLQRWAILFGSIAFFGMVFLLILTFFIKLPYRLWLFTHKFLGLAFFFAGLHVFFINSDVAFRGPLRTYMLFLCALGLVAFAYKTLLGSILIRRYKYSVEDVSVVGGNVTQVTLRPVKQRVRFDPGQFIFIRFLATDGGKISNEWHPFSISSAPDGELMQISVKAVGDYTSTLRGINTGAIAEIEGAYGKFSHIKANNLRQIWVAGGIGITPFLSMARSLPSDHSYDIDLYYSVKSRSEFIDLESLVRISNSPKTKFRTIPIISGNKRMLTAKNIESKSDGLQDKEIFICGPPEMMKSLRRQFRELGVSNNRMHSEEFAML